MLCPYTETPATTAKNDIPTIVGWQGSRLVSEKVKHTANSPGLGPPIKPVKRNLEWRTAAF